LDLWRYQYDYEAVNDETVERDDGWFAESLEEEYYKNKTLTPVNTPWICLTQERNATTGLPANHTGSGISLEKCDGTVSQQVSERSERNLSLRLHPLLNSPTQFVWLARRSGNLPTAC